MKTDKRTVMERVTEVTKRILDGQTTQEIATWGTAAWGVSRRMIDKYIRNANRAIAQDQMRDRGQAIARHLAQRRMLYARCIGLADHRTALAILRDEAELLGLYEAGKLTEEQRLQITLAALPAHVAELVRRCLALQLTAEPPEVRYSTPTSHPEPPPAADANASNTNGLEPPTDAPQEPA